MSFDNRKFERNASLGNLVRMGCSREVLRHAAIRFARASTLPRERRKGLREAGVSEKQLRTKAAEARDLAGFLRRLSESTRLVIANDPPKTLIPVWCNELANIAQWIESRGPFRPDKKDAALALAMHVEQRTHKQHLPELCKLLNAALDAAGLPNSLTTETLRKQIDRANRQSAERMLYFWEPLRPAKKLQE